MPLTPEQLELLERIKNLNDTSDQKEVQTIRGKIDWLNLNDPNNKPIFDAIRQSKYFN